MEPIASRKVTTLPAAITLTERDVWRLAGLQRWAGQDPKRIARALSMPVSEVVNVYRYPAQVPPLDDLLEQIPAPCDTWILGVVRRLDWITASLRSCVDSYVMILKPHAGNRGAYARAVQLLGIKNPAIRQALFLRLDGRPTEMHLWHAAKPAPGYRFTFEPEES
jgi:RNA ligase